MNANIIKTRKSEDLKNYILTIRCPLCGKEFEVTIPTEKLFWINQGKHIHEVLPEWSAQERDQLIVGMCKDCWNDFYGGE